MKHQGSRPSVACTPVQCLHSHIWRCPRILSDGVSCFQCTLRQTNHESDCRYVIEGPHIRRVQHVRLIKQPQSFLQAALPAARWKADARMRHPLYNDIHMSRAPDLGMDIKSAHPKTAGMRRYAAKHSLVQRSALLHDVLHAAGAMRSVPMTLACSSSWLPLMWRWTRVCLRPPLQRLTLSLPRRQLLLVRCVFTTPNFSGFHRSLCPALASLLDLAELLQQLHLGLHIRPQSQSILYTAAGTVVLECAWSLHATAHSMMMTLAA